MVGAKGVAQTVGFARHFRPLAECVEVILERVLGPGPYAAAGQRAERFKPCRQRDANFHEAALARLGLARRDFNVSRNTPHIRPIQVQQFGGAKSSQPADGDKRAQGCIGGFQQHSQFTRRVEINISRVRVFGPHRVRLVQTMADRQIILADAPRKKLREGGTMMVAAFGGEF